MGYASDPMGAALDRHITGNYGEDQYTMWCPKGGRVDVVECEENCPHWDKEKNDCGFEGEDEE